jgi:hypothetical protein
VSLIRHKLIPLLSAILLLVVSGRVCAAQAGIGFQAQLETHPCFISRYEAPAAGFSVARSPKLDNHLSARPKTGPKVIRACRDFGSLTFNTDYYKRLRQSKSLVPVTVDAIQYSQFRRQQATDQQFRKELNKSIADPDKRRAQRGLGLSVGLPKRLDRMFGEGGAGLVVSGYQRISFSGRSQWTDGSSNDSRQQSKFPSLNMEQITRFDITGTIGSKISVKVAQNSKQDIPLSNRIQIRYKGDDDDILKSIEAGNTTLSLPNTRFVGYSSRINGLFGLKASAEVGSLRLTAIASQEKGTSERASYSPTGTAGATITRDYEYADGRIFDLGRPGDLEPGDSVINLYIYEQVTGSSDLEADFVQMVVDPGDPDAYPGEREVGISARQIEIDQNRYEFINDPTKIPYVVFSSQVPLRRAVGMWMQVIKKGQTDTTIIGNIESDTLLLKLLRPSIPNPSHETWQLVWRNCYNVGRNANLDEMNIKIFKGLPGSEESNNTLETQADPKTGKDQAYIEILGLDQYNPSGGKYPDGSVDDLLSIYDDRWGLLIFPEREPFNSDVTFSDSSGRSTQELDDKASDIYDKAYNDASRTDGSVYFLSVATMTQSAVIKLNRPNIIEGSERVLVSGELQTRGTDYQIDYNFGTVTLLGADPNADVEIDYEYAPFLAMQKKTLLGVRAEYDWSESFKIGSTVLYKSDKAQDRKPKVGQETSNMMVYDVDATLKLEPNFLTRMVDALPLLESDRPSSLTLSGEVAQSHPNPNVEGVAWVDDFESALDRRSLGSSRVNWHLGSTPVEIQDQDYLRGKILWHSPRNVVPVDSVYDRKSAQGEGTIRTFRMIFRPQHNELDTVDFNADTTAIITETLSTGHPSWGGIMRYFSGLDATRAQLFEIRMRSFGSQGKLHFDFGQIHEDINGDGLFWSEDRDAGGGNGSVTEQEDTGVDQVFDPEESEWYHPVANPDPHGDNWYFDGNGRCPLPPDQCGKDIWDDESKRYEWLNGTEGNWQDISVLGRPDQEKLTDSEGRFNRYYSYELDLTTDSFLVEGTIKPYGNSAWKTFRIPIRDSAAIDGSYSDNAVDEDLDWGMMTHVRVWFEAAPEQTTWDTVEIADWYFVQSNWQDSVALSPFANSIPDYERTTFVVASASEEDGTFSPPPGVDAYTDRQTKVTEAQRGLAMEYGNLNRYDTCIALKELMQVEQYSGYRTLEMFVHSDIDMEVDDNGRSDLRFFFRIGKDGENFYEYRTYLYRDGPSVAAGWDDRNSVKFDFNELTGFKDSLIQANQQQGIGGPIDAVREPYRIKGTPNLNEIRYFSAGIVNMKTTDTITGPTGIVWLDELRLTDVRKDVGTAARFSASGNVADLFNYSFGYQSQDPYFRKMSSATRGGGANNLGSGKRTASHNYNLSASIDRFLPRAWGATIPVSFSYSKSVTTPMLRTGSDIVMPEDTRQEEQTVSESRSINISESFNYRGTNPFFKAILNRQNVRVSYRRSNSRSVNTPYSFSEGLDVQTGLKLGATKAPTLPILFWTESIPILKKLSGTKLGLYPSQWNLSVKYGRNTNVSDDRSYNRRSSLKRDLNGTMDISYNLLQNIRLGYTHASYWDMSDLSKVNISFSDLKLGEETRFSQTFSTGYDPSLFRWLGAAFTYRSSYSDDWDRTTDSRRSSMVQSWGVQGKFNHHILFGSKTKVTRGRGRGNARGGGGAQESTTRPIYDYPLALLRLLTGWIDAPTYSYSQDFKASIPGMAERPGMDYRFGLTREAGVPTVSQNQSPSSSEGKKYSASSGFTLLGGLRTDVKFSQTVGRDLVRSGNRMRQTSTNWPGLSIRIGKLSKLPVIKVPVAEQLIWATNQIIDKVANQVIERFGPKTSYNRTTREAFDLENGFNTLKSTNVSRSPLLELNFKILSRLTLTASYSLNKDESEKFNQSTGESDKITRSSQQSLSFRTSYSFSAPSGIGIPLLGRIKFQSQVSLTADVKINSDISEVSTRGGPWVPQSNKSGTQISAQVKYSFSKKINGGLSTRWQDQNDIKGSRKSHTREVQLWVEIKF